jgi:hypothetical protein
MWNVEDFLGHMLCLAASSAFIYHLICRLGDDEIFQYRWRVYVNLPLTLVVPVMVVSFWRSGVAHAYQHNLFAARPDWWLDLYWVMVAGFIIYAMVYGIWATLILREDPRSRSMANIYMTASILGIIACVAKIVSALDTSIGSHANGNVVWLFICLACEFYALGSAYSWIAKKRYLKAGIWRDIRKGRDINRYRTNRGLEPSV